MASEQSEGGNSGESENSTLDAASSASQPADVASENLVASASDAEEASKKEALASNPLASSRGSSLPQSAAKPVLLSGLEDDDAGESLADIVREVRYRPPTRLAAIGSSIVLVLVAGLWIAGDDKANAKASSTVDSENLVALVDAPDSELPVPMPGADDSANEVDPALVEAAAIDSEAALALARRLALEKAEQERAEQERLRLAQESLDPDVTDEPANDTLPEVVPSDSEMADPESVDPDLSDPEVTDEETPVDPDTTNKTASMEFDTDDTDVLPIDEPEGDPNSPRTNRVPKLTKKQQHAAAQAQYKIASVAFMQGKLAASEKAFKAALKADPTLATAYRGLGLVYERRGNKHKAAASLRRYLKLAPRASDAAAIRARLDRLGQ